MPTEIERKFLVKNNHWQKVPGIKLSQGYLNRDKNRTVRVRIAGDQAFLTIKGTNQGISRAEFEYSIPLLDAEQLMALCEGPIIEKTRYIVQENGSVWEIDVFMGANAGLIVAEIELASETENFIPPEWLGEEVSHDARYFNSSLSNHPYSSWHR